MLNFSHRPNDVATALRLLEAGNTTGISEVYNNINWTPENISDFQNTILSARQHAGFCWNDHTHPVSEIHTISIYCNSTYRAVFSFFSLFNCSFVQGGGFFNIFDLFPPRFDCSYEPPSKCNGSEPMSCCERVQQPTTTQIGKQNCKLVIRNHEKSRN